MLAVSRAQNPELFTPRVTLILPMTEIVFFKKACMPLFTCKDIKPSKVETRRVKTNITEMEAVRLKSSSVGLSDRKSATTKYVGHLV
jgi:hypothetical protein